MESKVYVPVTASFSGDGELMPLTITWEDGHIYQIDKVLDVRKAASLKAGGAGIRYTCRISGRQTYLFYEDGLWFVERRDKTVRGEI